MDEQKLVSDIKKGLQDKSIDELLVIWKENKRTRWSDNAFEAVAQILKERSVDLPEQDIPVTFEPPALKKIKDLKMPMWQTAVCIIVPALIIFFLGMMLLLKVL
jgi:hypothetical protein